MRSSTSSEQLVVALAACLLAGMRTPATAAESLLDAARANHHDVALALLGGQADLRARGVGVAKDGTTALHWAVYNGDADLARRLIAAGADVNARNDYGSTPLAEAAERADPLLLKLLLDAGADVESANAEGQTALMTVARTDRTDAAVLLLARGAQVNAREQWRGQTALMWAAAQRQPEMVTLLLEHGADANARSTVVEWARRVTAEPRPQNRPLGGLTPLLLAAREGCAACVRALVAGGADIELADPDHIGPLLMATLNANFDAAGALLQAGADVNRWDTWGRTPLYAAIDFNTVPRGGRPDRPSMDDVTPLQLAAQLLQAGANPNAQLKLFPPYRSLGQDRGGDLMLTTGATPLMRAAKAGDVDAVKLLLAHGALPGLGNLVGVTPLMIAAGVGSNTVDTRGKYRSEAQCVAVARLLLAAGAPVNARRDNGQTALHGAALWGWNDYARLLAEHGADLALKDNDGLTALDVALGKAGGTGRSATQSASAHPDTATLLQQLAAGAAPH